MKSVVSRRVAAAGIVAAMVAAPLVGELPAAHADTTSTFDYTGAEQSYQVPAGVTSLSISAIGGAGESTGSGPSLRSGGAAALVNAIVPVEAGQTLYVEVGGNGVSGDASAGGWNGGGDGGLNSSPTAGSVGGAGGGASDVRTVSRTDAANTLGSRLLVAGGGGGASGFNGDAGYGGGNAGGQADPEVVCGDSGLRGCGGLPGEQSSIGKGGAGEGHTGSDGSWGNGGSAVFNTSNSAAGGGGGGWYGGGAGGEGSGTAVGSGGGGGGSNYFAAGDTNTSAGYDVALTPLVSITPLYTVTVHRAGTGGGTVTGTGIDCGTTCSVSILAGSNEDLTATPASGSRFAGWSGGGCTGLGSPAGQCISPITDNVAITATFTKILPPPPNTKLTVAKIHDKKAKFRFGSTGKRTGFQCSLVKKGKPAHFTKCTSPKKYLHLAKAHYVFRVRAKGPGGVDKTPAKKTFSIS